MLGNYKEETPTGHCRVSVGTAEVDSNNLLAHINAIYTLHCNTINAPVLKSMLYAYAFQGVRPMREEFRARLLCACASIRRAASAVVGFAASLSQSRSAAAASPADCRAREQGL